MRLGSMTALGVILSSVLSIEVWSQGVATCIGDCNGDRSVDIAELVSAISIARGDTEFDYCVRADANLDNRVTIDEIVAAIGNASTECEPAVTCSGSDGNDTTSCNVDDDCEIGRSRLCCPCFGGAVAINRTAALMLAKERRFCCLLHCPHRPCIAIDGNLVAKCVAGLCELTQRAVRAP